MDQHKDDTRRLDGRQVKKRVYRDNGLPVVTNKRAVLCPAAGPRTTQGTQKEDRDRQARAAPPDAPDNRITRDDTGMS